GRARRGVRRPGALRRRRGHRLRPLRHRRVPRGCGDLRSRDRAGGRRPLRGAGAVGAIACPYANCHALKGWNLAHLGQLEDARRLIEQGRKLAREQGDIEVVSWSHMWSSWVAYFQGEPEAALAHAQQELEIAERIGGSWSRATAWFSVGWAERMRGEWQRAIEALERSLAIARERRTGVEFEARCLALLGESYLGLGDAERARG